MTWADKLKEAGFPTDVLLIDFESFYSADYHMGRDAKAISICEYIADPRFEMLGFGFQVLGHKWASLGRKFVPKPKVPGAIEVFKQHFGKALHNVTVVSFNSKFDMLILAEKYGIYPPFTVDIQDLSRTFDARMSHKLKDVAKLFGLPEKGDTGQFKGKHFDKIDPGALEEYTLRDIEDETALFKKLLPIIVNPRMELWAAAHTLRLYTRPKIHFDFDLAAKLKTDMQEQIDMAIRDIAGWVINEFGFSEEDQEDIWGSDCWREIVMPALSGDILFVKLLRAALPVGEAIPVKPGKPSKNMVPLTGPGMIPALAKDDDGLKALLVHNDETVRMLATARVAVNSWPGHINRIDKMAAQARVSTGLLRVPLKYYGCHTGRWSGEEKINLGNLGGAGRGKSISRLIGQVRHTMRAAPGCVFVLVDSAQIEARNVAWYAGQDDLVQEFAIGGDPYSSLASDLFQCRVWKWQKNDVEEYPGQEKKITIYRGFGKDGILGCGYGMGAQRFYDRCLANDELRPHFDSGEYGFETAKRVVDTYRTKYSRIPEFWGKVERAWRLATKYGHPVDVGQISFWHKDGTTFMRLPSGRIIRYRNARVNAHDELRWLWGELWGGSITENIVQSTCRDPLRDWLLMVERELHLPVVHHVYDELVVMVGEDRAEQAMKDVIQVMETAPAWATGMPFKAEGKISPYYTK